VQQVAARPELLQPIEVAIRRVADLRDPLVLQGKLTGEAPDLAPAQT
jgi:hypothetical protein